MNPKTWSHALAYRPEIDGLRAIAVLAVILFHIDERLLPCGFLGVDIFFVISGYLITSIILSERRSKRFGFKTFYRRRIQRILPLFFVVITTGLALSYTLMMPEDRVAIEKSALASCVFLANILFARRGDYFDVASEQKPFLHLWSLSAEEQFYLLFPTLLLLLLGTKWGQRHTSTSLLVTSLLLSLMAFLPLKRLGLNWAVYYLPHLRFGELLIGAWVASLGQRSVGTHTLRSLARPMAWGFVLYSMFAPRLYQAPWFPGISGLLFCLSVGIIIIDLRTPS